MKKKTLLILLSLVLSKLANSQGIAGPNDPSSFAVVTTPLCLSCPGMVWANIGNVAANDFQSATALLSSTVFCDQFNGCYKTRYLYTKGYGFNIPSTSTITGIQAEIRRFSASLNTTKDSSIMLINTSNNLVGINKASNVFWSDQSSAPYVTYGGPSDLWGATWTPASINNSNFGVSIKAYNSTTNNENIYVDHIRISVYFTCNLPTQPGAISGPTVLCVATSANYSIAPIPGSTSYTWTLPGGWTGTSNSNTITGVSATSGSISVAATNTCNTGPSQTLTVTVNPLPTLSVNSSNSVLCIGSSATLNVTGASSYTWDNSSTSNSIVVSPSINTTYSVNGVDANGCSNTLTFTQTVSQCTYIDSNNDLETLSKVFPNPSAYKIKLSAPEKSLPIKYTLVSLKGQIQKNSECATGECWIDIQTLEKGVYFLNITDKFDKKKCIKIIKD